MPVTTFVHRTDYIQRLQTSFQNLQWLRKQLDADEVIRADLFEQLQVKLNALTPVLLTKARFLQFQQQLTALYQYVYQFDTFQQLARAFFQETELHFFSIREKILPYRAFKVSTEQILTDFRQGNFWRTGITESIIHLENYIQQFYKEVVRHTNISIAKSLLVPIPKQIDWQVWAKKYLLPEVEASNSRFTQIRDWYHHHNYLLITDLIEKKDNELAPYLEKLRKVLPTADTTTVTQALEAFRKVVTPTRLLYPDGTQTLTSQLVNFSGEAEPHSLVRLVVNANRTLEATVDESGQFIFPEVRLVFGENKIDYYNHHFRFIDNEIHQLHLYVETNYPFLGRQDPLTQKAFEIRESQEIIRCKTCENYMYDYSVAEKNGECTLLWCDGKKFYRVAEKEFWQ